jgi:hypothetical protein
VCGSRAAGAQSCGRRVAAANTWQRTRGNAE